jgi:hypothetical protein
VAILGDFNNVNAWGPTKDRNTDIYVEFELLHTILTMQVPGRAKGLIVTVIMVSDMMLHVTAGNLQTLAVHV